MKTNLERAESAGAWQVPHGPVSVVMNAGAGAGEPKQVCRDAEALLTQAGRKVERFDIGAEPAAVVCRLAAQRARARRGIVLAAGGDGTVNAAAAACRETGVPLAILPLGTFNYFARLHGVPLEPAAAMQLLMDGVLKPVAAGEVNGQLFLNNASFGLYTRLIERRERDKARFGRRRAVAAVSAAATLLQGQEPFGVRIVAAQGAAATRTSMVFVANNSMQLELLGLDAAACTQAGALGVLMLRPTRLRERLRLLLRSALKELDADQRLTSFCAPEFEVESRRRVIDLVVDGEIVTAQTPLRFRAVPEALQLLVPA